MQMSTMVFAQDTDENICKGVSLSGKVKKIEETFSEIDKSVLLSAQKKFAKEIKKQKCIESKIEQYREDDPNKKIKRFELRSNLVLLLTKKKVKENKNRTFFYRTNISNDRYMLGKFIVRNTNISSRSCEILVESVTYDKNSTLVNKYSFHIRNQDNSWNIDRGTVDPYGRTSYELRREDGICVLKQVRGLTTSYAKTSDVIDEPKNELIYYASLFLIGLSVFLIARTVFDDEDRFKAQEKLEDADQDEKQVVPNDVVLKYSRPFFKRYFSPIVKGMKNKKKIKDKYKRKLASSGMNKFLTPEDFFAFKLFLIIGFPVLYLFLREFLELQADWPLMATPFVSILGFFYPDIWIKGKIDMRKEDVIQNMPFIVDMLALSVEAGLDFVAAMQKVIEKAPKSALVDEFETMIKETKIGSSRAEALRQMAWRIDSLPISSFCATLIAADSVGANIAPILKTLAGELRQKRSAAIEKKGAQASTKILIPMIFLIIPAVMIIIGAPMVLQLMGAK
jgi:tight adherence protein C